MSNRFSLEGELIETAKHYETLRGVPCISVENRVKALLIAEEVFNLALQWNPSNPDAFNLRGE